jgi:hypothetical protein
MRSFLALGLAMATGVSALLGFAGQVNATSTAVMDAIAPWEEVTRQIPVYVNGELVGYIVYTAMVWVDDERKQN